MEVLPPSDPASFVPPPELAEISRRFDAGDYRGCVEPIEALFFARRNTLHQGLLQYVVALLQLRRGMVRSPRRLLIQALALWEPYGEWQEGLQLTPARQCAASILAILSKLPPDTVEVSPEAAADWLLPPPALCGEAPCFRSHGSESEL